MSQTKKPAGTKKRNAKGQFVKGNKIGEETRFQKENEAACKYKEEYCDKFMEFFNQPDVDIQYKEVFPRFDVFYQNRFFHRLFSVSHLLLYSDGVRAVLQ